MAELSNLKGNILFVVDNVEESEGVDRYLREFTGLNIDLLLTSRSNLEGFEKLEIEELAKENCIELFKKYSQPDCNQEYVEKIVELAGYHPLTVELLSRTARVARKDLEEFYQLLKEKGFNLSDVIKKRINTSRHRDYDKRELFQHLRKVFDISNLGIEEKVVLLNLSILPSTPLKISNLEEWLKLENTDVIDDLIAKGWLKEIYNKDTSDYYVVIHNVIQEIVREEQELEFSKAENLVKAIEALLYSSPNENPLEKKEYVNFGVSILEYCRQENKDLANLSNNLGQIYKAIGKLDLALEYAEQAKNIYREVLQGEKHPDLADSYNHISIIYQDLGKLDLALKYAKQAKDIYRSIAG
ncbi:tetratricopeptide repeat protein [Halonatronum saccharophilum]|uniref:tetratricopeptide repeat protein n=1 Tax=Halonatronum saccharophilum TaxID=150060 RepID=UPI0004887200